VPITVADVQRNIVLRVGDIDPSTGDPPVSGGAGFVASNITLWWAANADAAVIAPRLQEYRTERDALESLIGTCLRQWVDITQGDPTLSVKLGARVQTAQVQLANVLAKITLIEQRAMAGTGAKVGQLTQREPVSPEDAVAEWWRQNPWFPDAGSPRYSGSPYQPMRGRP
jgi:hypothetical protein